MSDDHKRAVQLAYERLSERGRTGIVLRRRLIYILRWKEGILLGNDNHNPSADIGKKLAGQTAKAAAKGGKAAAGWLKKGSKKLLGWCSPVLIGLLIFLLFMMMIVSMISMFFAGAQHEENMDSNFALSDEVLAYRPLVEQYAAEYGIEDYIDVILAVMMQESRGIGADPMQSSECEYNTKYLPRRPNAITNSEYSIQVGIHYFSDCIKESGCTGINDVDNLNLTLQAYNFGTSFIPWAQEHSGYSQDPKNYLP